MAARKQVSHKQPLPNRSSGRCVTSTTASVSHQQVAAVAPQTKIARQRGQVLLTACAVSRAACLLLVMTVSDAGTTRGVTMVILSLGAVAFVSKPFCTGAVCVKVLKSSYGVLSAQPEYHRHYKKKLGLITTHIVLGVAASLGGEWVQNVMGRWWGLGGHTATSGNSADQLSSLLRSAVTSSKFLSASPCPDHTAHRAGACLTRMQLLPMVASVKHLAHA